MDMIKWHKKFDHHTSGVAYFGERGEVPLRINLSINDSEVDLQEPLHYHKESAQLFLVVEGSVTIEVEGERFNVTPDKLLEIEPGAKYRVIQVSKNSKWLVIGTVNKEGDRVEVG